MALIKCSECGTEVSDRADKCPKCGCPVDLQPDQGTQTTTQNDNKKKRKSLIGIILILLALPAGYLLSSTFISISFFIIGIALIVIDRRSNTRIQTQKNVENAQSPKKKIFGIQVEGSKSERILILSFLLFIFIAILSSSFGGNNNDVVSQTSNTNKDNSTVAYVQAQNFVKSVLKSPSSADFPFLGSGTKISEDIYKITSYVDSQNGFGAMIRSDYSITLMYLGGDPADQRNWTVKEFIFDGETVVEDTNDID